MAVTSADGVGERLALTAREVTASASGSRLLAPASLKVSSGELVALIGPSGSGKTSLLRVLAGVHVPDEGEVLLGDDPVSVRSHEVGYLPANDILHDRLTIREALRYSGRLRLPRGTLGGDIDLGIMRVLGDLRLEHRADSLIGSLSAGERKRAALAAELLGDPPVLLLDEPAAALDPSLERQLMTTLRGIADGGRGVVVVTHATSSLSMCDAVAVMQPGGRLARVGPPKEVLEHFGATAYDEIYDSLGEPEETDEPPAPVPRPEKRLRPPIVHSFSEQTVVLASRYARVFVRDTRTLALLLGQAPIIGIFIGAVLPTDVIGSSVLAPIYGVFLAFMLLTGCIWLGLAASHREIAKERTIFDREAAAGVRLDSYLAAKFIVLVPVGLVQVVLLLIPTVVLQPLHVSMAGYMQVVLMLAATAWASIGMGLAVSARARSVDQASAMTPLLIIPQMLFAGAIIPTIVMPKAVQAITYLAYSRWAMAGTGSAMGLGPRLSENVASVTGYDGSFFQIQVAAAMAETLLFGLVFAVIAARALDRSRTL